MPSHLTEAEIQAMLDAGTASPHLSSCESCRNVFNQYRALYGNLSRQPDRYLPADFAKKTADRVFPQPASVWPKVFVSVFILAGIAAVLAVLQFFIGMLVFRQGFAIFASLFRSTWDLTVASLKTVQSGLGKGFGMIVQAGLTLYILNLLDRTFRRVRQGS
jgi:predicted anti-sigma-YlaC factor YlaD